MKKNILVADDDAIILNLIDVLFAEKDEEIEVRRAESGKTTIDAINQKKPDVLVLDIKMHNGDGFSVLDFLHENKLDIPVIIFTNYRSEKYEEKCKKYGVKEYIVKADMKTDRVIEKIQSYLQEATV